MSENPSGQQEPLDEVHPHTPADDKEEVYYEGSPLLRAECGKLAGYGVIAAVIVAIPILLKIYGHGLPTSVVLVLVLIALIWLFIPVLLIRSIRYRISNYRIDYERGLLSKTIDTLELWHVEDIHFHQSLADRMLNVGDITIMSHDDTTPELLLRGIPNPRGLFETLKQRVIAVKRQRGVIKMDIGT
jgi:hypothetical protein